MKHPLPPLDRFKAFEAAARHLSFSLAADELCISKGAISYQIRKLEEEIKSTLFKRSVRQVNLTDAGQKLLHTTRRLFNDLEETLNRLEGDRQQASVSIAVTTYVASRWLSSRISRFSEQNPDIDIVFQHSVNSSEFKLTDVDMAIRWGPCRSNADKKLFDEIPISMYPVINPELMKRHSLQTSKIHNVESMLSGAFKDVPLLCEDRQQDLWQEWFNSNISKPIRLMNPRRIISDSNVRVQAAIDGQGLILADELMSIEINNKLLIAPFKETLEGYGYAFLSSPNRLHNDNATTLKEWLLENN